MDNSIVRMYCSWSFFFITFLSVVNSQSSVPSASSYRVELEVLVERSSLRTVVGESLLFPVDALEVEHGHEDHRCRVWSSRHTNLRSVPTPKCWSTKDERTGKMVYRKDLRSSSSLSLTCRRVWVGPRGDSGRFVGHEATLLLQVLFRFGALWRLQIIHLIIYNFQIC